jgi:hypothetical protein
MKNVPLRASYLCAAVALGLLAIHFNAGALAGWTPAFAALAAFFALPGALLAGYALGRRGWTSLQHWPVQVAFALNALLALAFLFYASPE